jgi:DNA-binding NarL/FixJ family response regulator
VVIAEDSVLLREGLTRLLTDRGLEVVGSVGDGEALLELVDSLVATPAGVPDVVVADVRMPPTHTDEGVRACIELRARHPEVGTLMLSQYVEERYASELLAGSTRGVGYLLKDRVAEVREFVDAVTRVAEGGTALDPEAVAQLLGRSRRYDVLDGLTPREREVLGLMGRGPQQHGRGAAAGGLRRGRGEACEQHLPEAGPGAEPGGPPAGPGGAHIPELLSGEPLTLRGRTPTRLVTPRTKS